MDMIQKISVTASAMLFVLAQAFSLYMIGVSQREKLELMVEQEGELFQKCIREFGIQVDRRGYEGEIKDHVIIYYFRQCMPENCAIYKGEEELYNGSPYAFEVRQVNLEEKGRYNFYGQEEINGRSVLLFCEGQGLMGAGKAGYTLFYVVDVTFLWEDSLALMAREAAISLAASVGMALLLVWMIKKITRPLQAVNEAQRQLIGSMSHELKTPLTAIKGYAETLLQVELSKEQEEKALRYIDRESGRLSRISEKMMELTRLYEPECEITLQKVPLERLLAEVEESVRHRLIGKRISLVREGEWQGKALAADPDLMASFLINLINNSVMASEEGSRIYVGANGHALWVRDEGCGIPPAEVDKVRKAFYRVDKSRSRKSGNMGLGLALCEQIAAVHGGTMEIESEIGKGTKVSYYEG